MDVGAAEGYYVNGLVWTGRAARAIAFEADPGARHMLARHARRNGVDNRVEVRGWCYSEGLSASLGDAHPALLIVDVEGGEVDLLDDGVARLARATSLIVENHPWVNAEAAYRIASRFVRSHEVTEIPARRPSPEDIENPLFRTLASAHSRLAKRIFQQRPQGMFWLPLRSLAHQG